MMLEMESVSDEDGVWYTCNTRAIRNFKFEMRHILQAGKRRSRKGTTVQAKRAARVIQPMRDEKSRISTLPHSKQTFPATPEFR
jgi:hypothetical protein